MTGACMQACTLICNNIRATQLETDRPTQNETSVHNQENDRLATPSLPCPKCRRAYYMWFLWSAPIALPSRHTPPGAIRNRVVPSPLRNGR